MGKPILCLDFDGVLHSYTSGWKGEAEIPDAPVLGAVEFVREAVKEFTVVIHSSRSHQLAGIDAMRGWLWKWKFPVDEIQFAIGEKPSAHVTLDDRGWQFNGKFPSIQELKDFKPWYKR